MTYKILGYPAWRMGRNAALAIIAGGLCGKCGNNLKNHPGLSKEISNYSLYTGVVGASIGASIGIWQGRQALLATFMGGIQGTFATICFLNVRSLMKNQHFSVREGQELNDVQLTAFTGGLIGSLSGLFFWRGFPVFLGSSSMGLVFGFLGHLLYRRLEIVRLEVLLHHNHPDLIAEFKAAEAYMDEQMTTNPDYTGPVRENPSWLQWLDSQMQEPAVTSNLDEKLHSLQVELDIIKQEQKHYS